MTSLGTWRYWWSGRGDDHPDWRSPRCGKSSIARAWASTTASSYLPADYLTSAVSGYLTDEDTARLLPRLPGTFRDNDTKFENFSIGQIIENYRTKAATTWSAVRDVAGYALADGNNFVIEGYQVEPKLVAALQDELCVGALRCLFVYHVDIDATHDALQRHRVPNDRAHDPLIASRRVSFGRTHRSAA